MGEALEEWERKEAKKRQREHAGTAPGRAKNSSGTVPEVSKGQARDKVGAALGMAGTTYEMAKAVVQEGDAELVQMMDTKGVRPAYAALKRKQKVAEVIASRTPPRQDERHWPASGFGSGAGLRSWSCAI